MLEKTDDDAQLSNVVVAKTAQVKEAELAEAEAFRASQQSLKEYQVKLKGAGKVTVQLTSMGVQITSQKGKPPRTLLYQSLENWGLHEKRLQLTPKVGNVEILECTGSEAAELSAGISAHAQALAAIKK